MTRTQTLALFECIRRALLMIVRHLEPLIDALQKELTEPLKTELTE